MILELLNQHPEWTKLTKKLKIKEACKLYFGLIRTTNKKQLSEYGKKGMAVRWDKERLGKNFASNVEKNK